MSISPINFNGMMQRSQDVSTLKHNEDNQPVVQQNAIAHQEEKKIIRDSQRVVDTNKKDPTDTHHDAREEGKNKYFNNYNQNKRKEEDGKVTKKSSSSGFDIRI